MALLGGERRARRGEPLMFSDFGGSEDAEDDDVMRTAAREYAEETAGLWTGGDVQRAEDEMLAMLRAGRIAARVESPRYVMFVVEMDHVDAEEFAHVTKRARGVCAEKKCVCWVPMGALLAACEAHAAAVAGGAAAHSSTRAAIDRVHLYRPFVRVLAPHCAALAVRYDVEKELKPPPRPPPHKVVAPPRPGSRSKQPRFAANDSSGAHEVVRDVWLSGVGAARDVALLRAIGITHVVVAGGELRPYHRGAFEYMQIPVLDKPDQRVDEWFVHTNAFIAGALECGGRVLVHCMQGKSRSVSVCIAFLVQHRAHSVRSALATVRKARTIACPNDGFAAQLRTWEHSRGSGLVVPPAPRVLHAGDMDDGESGAGGHGARPHAFHCAMCSALLFDHTQVTPHAPGAPQRGKNAAPCVHVHVEMDWDDARFASGAAAGELTCAQCGAACGAWCFAGRKCSCGEFVAPWHAYPREGVVRKLLATV